MICVQCVVHAVTIIAGISTVSPPLWHKVEHLCTDMCNIAEGLWGAFKIDQMEIEMKHRWLNIVYLWTPVGSLDCLNNDLKVIISMTSLPLIEVSGIYHILL